MIPNRTRAALLVTAAATLVALNSDSAAQGQRWSVDIQRVESP